MRLVRYDPFKELHDMERSLAKLWDEGWGVPAVADTSAMDLYEEDGKLVAEVNLPNFKKDEINVTSNEGVLEINAEHKEDEEKKNKRRYYMRESSNKYLRRVALPDNAEAEKAQADFKDGQLKVTIPLTEKTKDTAKEIKIK